MWDLILSVPDHCLSFYFNYLDPILIYISLRIDCIIEIRKIAVYFLWLSLPGHYRVMKRLY